MKLENGAFSSEQIAASTAELLPFRGKSRSRRLEQMLFIGGAGQRVYSSVFPAPLERSVLGSEFFYANINPVTGEVYTRFLQSHKGSTEFTEGYITNDRIDGFFGIPNVEGKTPGETKCVLEARVFRDSRRGPWGLSYQFLTGENLMHALSQHERLTSEKIVVPSGLQHLQVEIEKMTIAERAGVFEAKVLIEKEIQEVLYPRPIIVFPTPQQLTLEATG